MERCLLVIYAPPALEETLVDWLLENDEVSGFSTAEAYGHGQHLPAMSLLEQVTGRQRRVQLSIEASRDVMVHLLEQMREKFRGAGLHYMLLPVIEAAHV